ncbi:MAG TPA: 50S ribosomal protein L29 [Bacteroidetes bacterium]|jgi:large subunit ribosomal protein L29|nr:50S ribosomal protein L29 [Bacteroidota bacterium]|tara:strand:- start:2613 stop:2816 length:204 start_codon:yes stop_codon:yes gene_type:complete
MQYQDIKKMTEKELHLNLKDERAQLQKMKFSHAVSPIENPHKIRVVRKTIAKYLTEINSRRHENTVA